MGLLLAEAVVIVVHASQLLADVVRSEETLGLAALPPLSHETAAAIAQSVMAVLLVVASVALRRGSRTALLVAIWVQMILAVEIMLRVVRGLAAGPTLALAALTLATSATLVPIWRRLYPDEPPAFGT